MKTGIATVSVPGVLSQKLAAIAAAGFDGIEIFEQDFIADAHSPAEIGRMVRDHGLEILLFQPFRDFEGLPEPLRSKAMDRAERKFDAMQALGVDLMLVCSSVHPQALGGIDRAAADLAELGRRAAARGLRVGYEALAWGRYVDDHRDAWEIVRRADHPAVGLILDSFHTLGRGIDPDSIRRIPGDRIFFVQLADAPRIDMDLLYWSRHFRNMPGEGDLPVGDFLSAVLETGYTGPLSLEIFNDQFRGGQPRGIARDGHRALLALMDDVARRRAASVGGLAAAAGTATSGAAAPMPAAPLPAVQPVRGTAYLEVAARDEDATAVERALGTLGFTRAGRHPAKAAELWSQGDIRIIVNAEFEDQAGAAYNVHGPCIYEVGLMVDDPTALRDRALGLGAEPFSQPGADGTELFAGIRGPGGLIFRFLAPGQLPGVFRDEFGHDPRDRNVGAGLARVDHVAATMSYDEMLSSVLFYRTVFGMEKAPLVDVADPDGLVRSQAMRAAGGAFRTTLNGAEQHRTLAGSFLSDSFGASIQHLALATDDIMDTARRLAKLGFEALPISDNYYADLAARFDLGAAEIAALQAGNILYDEDAQGRFWQLYSRPLFGGLFAEIVQRDRGYDGYGAPNAPFRTAAMKRLMRPSGMPLR
ncbi:bifunctional sugar phosphate isomerase/epimerase/4-hydroxyphenylpyruvate dioxygenase family protein [Paracoccus sanguinis]|uniref:3-dehydroshikimate dehydratase n=1 Tax=Paracoccus sanguinis TaxID=1545044 RepID=A0A1H2U4R5_9RHOB|nr:sugar phosphate isomerase/epimerase and 4-hydroxyphenylpyruvate domain-containing protein [Paracoccus sanguinis]KGJ17651.1 3-keto-5-aminohexanoate cleavage protein [Paracoccus sanguinis]SDW50927.1 4-hydroxyphenylpyruvate dioxygenase [Paracoccus sanguinis]